MKFYQVVIQVGPFGDRRDKHVAFYKHLAAAEERAAKVRLAYVDGDVVVYRCCVDEFALRNEEQRLLPSTTGSTGGTDTKPAHEYQSVPGVVPSYQVGAVPPEESSRTSGVWIPVKGDRVRLAKKIPCTAPVGSEGEVTMTWEPTTSNGISRPAQFCVGCEGYPAFVTEASNLEPCSKEEVESDE